MYKVIFFDFDIIEEHKNVQIYFHSPKEKKELKVISEDAESLQNSYYHFIKYDNEIQVYYRSISYALDTYNEGTCKAILFQNEDNEYEWKDIQSNRYPRHGNKFIYLNNYVGHNFTPFVDKFGKIKAVGGVHINKHQHQNKIVGKRCKSKFFINYKGTDVCDPNKEHICKGNGLYLLNEKDGKWNIELPNPIINGTHPGETTEFFGVSVFDTQNSLFYHTLLKKYYLYTRSNLDREVRHIQYTTSKNLIEWEPFKLLNISKKFDVSQDNYYQSNMLQYLNTKYFIGFPTFFQNDADSRSAGIYLCFSHNGEDWICGKRIIGTGHINQTTGRFKNSAHSCHGLILSEDETKMYIFVLDNYVQYYKYKPLKILQYSIRADGFSSIQSSNYPRPCSSFKNKLKKLKRSKLKLKTDEEDNLECYFITKKLCFLKKLSLNFETCTDGYISISILDECKKVTQESEEITGNEINKVIFDNISTKCGYLKITLWKAQIFSLNFI